MQHESRMKLFGILMFAIGVIQLVISVLENDALSFLIWTPFVLVSAWI